MVGTAPCLVTSATSYCRCHAAGRVHLQISGTGFAWVAQQRTACLLLVALNANSRGREQSCSGVCPGMPVVCRIDSGLCVVVAGDHAACQPARHLASGIHSWCGAAKACCPVQVRGSAAWQTFLADSGRMLRLLGLTQIHTLLQLLYCSSLWWHKARTTA